MLAPTSKPSTSTQKRTVPEGRWKNAGSDMMKSGPDRWAQRAQHDDDRNRCDPDGVHSLLLLLGGCRWLKISRGLMRDLFVSAPNFPRRRPGLLVGVVLLLLGRL
jgi:hypothetical protein